VAPMSIRQGGRRALWVRIDFSTSTAEGFLIMGN
jgi:hypothetical protein